MLTIRQMRNVVRTVRISDAVAPIRYGTHSISGYAVRAATDVTVKMMWRGVVRKAARFVTRICYFSYFSKVFGRRSSVPMFSVLPSEIGRGRDVRAPCAPACGPRCGRGCVCTSEGSLPRRWLGA